MSSLSLLSNLNRVESPFVKVTIGDYTFGVYEKNAVKNYDATGIFKMHEIKYPNYIQSLNITKINGQVNRYELRFDYPVTQNDDPNFFEKVFSSVSRSRKIIFSYGDFSMPTYIYKDEEALILKVRPSVNVEKAVISYTVEAISRAILSTSGTFNWDAKYCKPSDEIKRILRLNSKYGLQDVFYGMRDYDKVISDNLIRSDDRPVQLEYQSRMSVFDYLSYLVNSMIPLASELENNKQSAVYSLTVIDDTSGVYGGPYFTVKLTDKKVDIFSAYEIDVGFPSKDIILDYSSEVDDTYSIYYDYQQELNNNEYAYRINRQGQLEEIYSPAISSDNEHYETQPIDKTWWGKVTEFPIKAKITIKGLLRPAVLMTHVRLNLYFFGKKFIQSGLYIITQQQDSIGLRGNFKTTLTMVRISGDDEA